MRGARKGQEGAWETSPDKVLHGDCVYSSLQGVCNNNGYDFIQPEKSPPLPLQEITEQNGCIVSGSRQIKANGGDDAETFQLCPLDLLPAGSMHSLQRLGENSSGSAGSHCNANWTLNRANYCPPASVFITNPPPSPHATGPQIAVVNVNKFRETTQRQQLRAMCHKWKNREKWAKVDKATQSLNAPTLPPADS